MSDRGRRRDTELRHETTWMTCVLDRLEHAVSLEDFGAGLRLGLGYYTAVCGHVTFPQALVSPHGRPCPECTLRLALGADGKTAGKLRRLAAAGRRLRIVRRAQ
ncbi:hypothetical protein [Pseudonocardia acaciae]|uniref:hypothetical protein n=1 Tax=Pseudonocardia acaciae TaxID=551276 RepID=UPI00048B8FC4|nr:hypothetical protein [Pseudonocardia acaciae]